MEKHHSSLNLSVHKLESIFWNKPESVYQPHMQTQFEIIFVTEGSGLHIIDGERYPIESGNISAALPGHKHQFIPDTGICGYVMYLDPLCIHNTVTTYKISNESILHYYFSRHRQLHVAREQIESMVEAFSRLENELSNQLSFRNEIANTYLQILLLYIRREIEHVMRSDASLDVNPLLKKFLLLVENNYREKKTIADYAAALFVTPNYLHHVIKQTSGYSPGYHIRQRIIQEAKRKFMYSGASLKEISYDLGFDNMAHFSKLFKNTTGKNFTQFKKDIFKSVNV